MSRILLRNLLITITALSVFFAAGAVRAETDLMILLDASSSMTSPGTPGTSHTKFDEVRAAITNLLQALPPDVAVGLRLMGTSPAADCYFSMTFSTPRQGDRGRMQDFLDTVYPAGTRALYQGIDDSISDFSHLREGVDRVLLIITDGGDGCDRDLSVIARQYEFNTYAPQVIAYGLDLNQHSRDSIGEIVRATRGRLTNVDDMELLPDLLGAFATQFSDNLRVNLADIDGNAVSGDVVIENTATGQIVAELLDVFDFSLNVDPGTYVIKGRYRGEEIRSDTLVVTADGNYSINLEFNMYLEPFTLMLRDIYEQPLRARVTFLNMSLEPVLTTDIDSTHRVELPSGSYSIQIRMGDMVYDFAGILVGPGYDSRMVIEIPVALGILEVEIANIYGTPLNARVLIYDMDGSVMDEAPYTSYLYARVPPGNYRVVAEFHGRTVEKIITLNSGDQMQVDLEIQIELGDIYIQLRTESGYDAWGWVKLYDSDNNLFDRYDRETIEQPEWSFSDIPVGIYTIEAEVDGVVRVVTGVEVRSNEETSVEVEFPDETY